MSKNEKKEVLLECPRCHITWAKFAYRPDGSIAAKDVKILEGSKVFKDGDAFECSCCGYPHTTWDLFLAIGAGEQKNK
jgi:hypothetical protein